MLQFSLKLPTDEVIDVEPNDRQVFELVSGEKVTIAPGALTLAQVSGAAAALSGADITPSAIGASRFTVTTADGSVATLNLLTCESACLTVVGAASTLPGRTFEFDSPIRRRHVLRAIATSRAAWFTGTAASLSNQNLAIFGG